MNFREYLNEAKDIKVEILYLEDDIKADETKFKVKIKPTSQATAKVVGKKENIIALMKSIGQEDKLEDGSYPELD